MVVALWVMVHRRIALASAPVFALLGVQACFSSDNGTPSPAGDAGNLGDSTTLGDGAPGGEDTGTGDDGSRGTGGDGSPGTGDDGGPQGISDAGSPDGNPCGDPVRIDLGTGTLAANFIAAATYQGAHLAIWPDNPAQTDAGAVHLRARVFDGDAGITDLGPVEPGVGPLATLAFAADGTGHAFAMWEPSTSSTDANQAVFPFGATIGAVTTTTVASGYQHSVALAPLAAGAISFHPAAPPTPGGYADSFASETWSAGPGWTATGLTTTGGTGAGGTIATSLSSGKAVASWYDGSPGQSSFAIHVITFNGSTWAAPVTRTFASDGGAGQIPGAYAYTVRGNGNAVFFFYYSTRIDALDFDASTSTFGAPTTIAQGNLVLWFPSYNTSQWAAIDSADRITVAWPMYGDAGIGDTQLYVSRNLGSGWSAPEALGATPGADYKVVRDPATERIVAGADQWVRSISATGTTWSKQGVLGDQPNRLGALTFDGATTIVVHAAPPSSFSSLLGLYATRCAL